MDGETHTSTMDSAARLLAAGGHDVPAPDDARGVPADATLEPGDSDMSPPVPAVLARDRFRESLRQFMAEYQPVGPTELALVRDLARQAAAMERWGDAAEAVGRHAARTLPQVALAFAETDPAYEDALLSGAMATETADRCERHSLARSRAFTRTMQQLEQVQTRRKTRQQTGAPSMPPAFPDEAACIQYLERRLRSEATRCRKCGAAGGCYLPSRRTWECATCRTQAGLRAGTVMAGSALKFLTWFEAIRWLLWRPTIGATELGQRIAVRRPTTVRTIARRIRQAMAADDASDQLAGLDVHYARDGNVR